jgi:hypothetical protein
MGVTEVRATTVEVGLGVPRWTLFRAITTTRVITAKPMTAGMLVPIPLPDPVAAIEGLVRARKV